MKNCVRESRIFQNERDELKQRVISMAKELESATDTGLELNKMLTDFLTSQKENASLSSNLDQLQSQITRQENIISQLRNKTKQTEEEVQ